MSARTFLLLLLLLISGKVSNGQIPVEVFAGNERTTVDIMFFKYFRKQNDKPSKWLFFNRNRAAIDYRMTDNKYLPQFGFTEAISYNHSKLKGLAPVMVGQVLTWGTKVKTGIQYAFLGQTFTAFTWLVTETNKKPDIDHFVLLRYVPNARGKVQLFSQLELLTVLPTDDKTLRTYTQRMRVGIKVRHVQSGVGADMSQAGNTTTTKTTNAGVFLRYEF